MPDNINLENLHLIKKRNIHNNLAIFAMFMDINSARNAAKLLKKNSFASEDISILTPDKKGRGDFVYHQVTGIKNGVIIGATVGFFILSVVGIFIGSREPQHVGFSALIVDAVIGALIGLLFGAAAGALAGIGVPQPTAKRYKFYLKEGGILVMMHLQSEDDSKEAHSILEKAGGQDISILEESQILSTIMPEEHKSVTFH